MHLFRAIVPAAFLLAFVPAWTGAQVPLARLSGQLLAGDGSPVAGAEIEVGGSRVSNRSDSAGKFLVEAAPSGRVRLQVRVLGFSPLDTTLALQAGETYSVTLRMARTVQQLDPVVTEAVLPYGKPIRYQHTGRFDEFYERRAKRPGTYFTREDIERSGRNTAMELMSSVPGVTVNFRPGDGQMYLRFARCEGNSIWNQKRPPDERQLWFSLFINGRRITGGVAAMQTLGQLRTDEIETIEVYRGPSQLPVDAVGDACAAVFITTRFTTGSVLPKK